MSQKYQIDELDEATRSYLLMAKQNKGAGLPGVFLGGADSAPVFALFFGLIVLLATFFGTFPSRDEPARTAMLQTAGFLLGGWLMLYALRTWSAQARGSNLGRFWYADPNYLWDVRGSQVEIIPLETIRSAAGTEAPSANVRLLNISVRHSGGENKFLGQNLLRGSLLVDYLNLVPEIKSRYPEAKTLSPSQLGFNVLSIAETSVFPNSLENSNGGLLDSLPHPMRARTAYPGILPLVIIFAFCLGGFLLLKELNVPWRDHAAFVHAQEGMLPGMREYLLDPRNTLHREEAEQYVSAAFTKVIGQIRSRPEIDKEYADAFIKILEKLRDDKKAVLSIRVQELSKDQQPGVQAGDATSITPTTIVERIQNKIITGTEEGLLGLYETSEEDRANVEFIWKFIPSKKGQGAYDVQWNLILRDGSRPELAEGEKAKPLLDKTEIFRNNAMPSLSASNALNVCLDSVMTKTLGKTMEIQLIPADVDN